jgi:hypothetical protein
MVLRHHVLYAIHHKLTSDLPRIFTTNLRNPPQNTRNSRSFPPYRHAEKKYGFRKDFSA